MRLSSESIQPCISLFYWRILSPWVTGRWYSKKHITFSYLEKDTGQVQKLSGLGWISFPLSFCFSVSFTVFSLTSGCFPIAFDWSRVFNGKLLWTEASFNQFYSQRPHDQESYRSNSGPLWQLMRTKLSAYLRDNNKVTDNCDVANCY